MLNENLYTTLSQLLDYPRINYRPLSKDLATKLVQIDPKWHETVTPFIDVLDTLDDGRIEELYTSTFEVQGVCCLDVGYAMFGEDYKRGQYMAELKVLYRELNIDCGAELPDHLSNMLKMIPKLGYSDAFMLVQLTVLPAIAKMKQSFGDSNNIYRSLLTCVEALLNLDFAKNTEVAYA